MPKYTNKEKFIQPVRINGNRIIVRPGEVFSTDQQIDLNIYSFLQLVPDNTPVSVKTSPKPVVNTASKEQVNNIKDEISELKKSFKQELEKVKYDILKDTPAIEESEIKSLHEKVDTCLKRLEVLKEAVTIIDKALHNLEIEVYENSSIVITDEEKE